MDRYDRIIRDVQEKTDDEFIQWRAVRCDKYSDILLNSHRVIRSFEADYPVGGRGYLLLFIERKIEYPDDLGYVSEGRGFEMFVLDEERQIVVSLYDGVVDRDDLLRLSGLIDEHNDRAKAFFARFEEPGAA